MSASRILVADDEVSIRKVLSAMLRRNGYEVVGVEDGAQAVRRLQEERFHLLVTDLRMPRMGGMELLAWCREHAPGVPVIILTAYGTVNSAVEALKLGAHDYVTKPFDQDDLKRVVGKALASERHARREPQEDAQDPSAPLPGLRHVRTVVEGAAASGDPVLILGEPGTGKALVARSIHELSDRHGRPFIHVHCGAIAENLFDAELFGYERGAFPGTAGSKPGRIELADGGTLFLDEVSELPPDTQARLLDVLRDRAFGRVGGARRLPVDIRLVAASHVDLPQAVAAHRFQRDLYDALAGVVIRIPPLRERIEDIPILVEQFVKTHPSRRGGRVRDADPEALAALQAWSWPGNVRELQNVVERAVLTAEGDRIGVTDLEGILTAPGRNATAPEEDLGLHEFLRVHLARLERERIRRALEAEAGNVTRTARRLGISRKGLQLKMKEYGLRGPSRQEGGLDAGTAETVGSPGKR
ncbi:MAG: sigma-54-dependent Fis family transcriptional regulator [Deltaproteobacteria bacterium]|nr:sigma-54-dependent Fis family transcriptional regulator [Deltaproteobacteria bacterium]